MKKIIKMAISLLVVGIVAVYISRCGKEEITREQQKNLVKRLAQNYDIKSIEFLELKKTIEPGYYRLTFKINKEDRYKTVIYLSRKEQLNNSTDEIGLSPEDKFKELERRERILPEDVKIDDADIKYI